jgi:hypothetical protein
MSVFKEKDGSCEGANLLCGKARFQVSPGRFDIGRGFYFDSQYIGAARLSSVGWRSARWIATAYAGVFGKGGDSKENS